MSEVLFSAVFVSSLLGSLHCAGMCGPFVAFYAADAGTGKHPVWAHLGYHLGRLLTYSFLGGIAGGVGAVTNWAFDATGVAQVAALLSGIVVLVGGLSSFFPAQSGLGRLREKVAAWFQRTQPVLLQLGKKPREVRATGLGLLTPLLPCSWLYAFVILSAGTGSALQGALLMAVFWAGTVPALWGMGAVVTRLSRAFQKRLPLLTGASLMLLGLWGIVQRAQHPVPQALQEETPAASSEVPDSSAHCH